MTSLFTPHKRGSETSKAAAGKMTTAATTQAARVYAFIVQRGLEGATDQEIQDGLGLTGDSERPRRRGLQKIGLINDSGKTRKSPAGRDSVVWISKEIAAPTDNKETTVTE